MKAIDKQKNSIDIDEIYKQINECPPIVFKHFIPHMIYVSDSFRFELLANGFKLPQGDWDGHIKNALIIEW